MAQTREMSWEDDEEMLALLEQKHEMEDNEQYNAPETMARKRKAVKEAAISIPAPKSSTDLDFDDDVEPVQSVQSEPDHDDEAEESDEQDNRPKTVRLTTVALDIKNKEEATGKRPASKDAVRVAAKARPAAKKANKKRAGQASPRKVTALPAVRLDPESHAKKSKTAQRRSRQRLRRMEREQEELLSSQLQVV